MELILSYKIRFVRKTRISNCFFLLFLMKRIFRLIPIHIPLYVLHIRPGESIDHFTHGSNYGFIFHFWRRILPLSGRWCIFRLVFSSRDVYTSHKEINVLILRSVSIPVYTANRTRNEAIPPWNSVFLSSVKRIRWYRCDVRGNRGVARTRKFLELPRVGVTEKSQCSQCLQSQGCSDENATREKIAFRFYEKLFKS